MWIAQRSVLSLLAAGLLSAPLGCTEPPEQEDRWSWIADGFPIIGDESDGTSAYRVIVAGDINGDALDDVIVEARWPDAHYFYVHFGMPGDSTVRLIDIRAGIGGFVIEGLPVLHDALTEAGLARPIVGAGDVNGDGLDDILIGPEPGSVTSGRDPAAVVYLVFGKQDTAPVTLADLEGGVSGQVVAGEIPWEGFGAKLAGVGDVNGDSYDDLLIATSRGPGAFVLFGNADALAQPSEVVSGGGGGYLIAHPSGIEVVSGIGDVNDDSLADILIGCPADPGGRALAYVVFGKEDSDAVALAELAESEDAGFVINGAAGFYAAGCRLARVRDVATRLILVLGGVHLDHPPAWASRHVVETVHIRLARAG